MAPVGSTAPSVGLLGLEVAAPAVLDYNALLIGNKSILNELNRFAHDLHAYFVAGVRVGNNPADGKIVSIRKAQTLTLVWECKKLPATTTPRS